MKITLHRPVYIDAANPAVVGNFDLADEARAQALIDRGLASKGHDAKPTRRTAAYTAAPANRMERAPGVGYDAGTGDDMGIVAVDPSVVGARTLASATSAPAAADADADAGTAAAPDAAVTAVTAGRAGRPRGRARTK